MMEVKKLHSSDLQSLIDLGGISYVSSLSEETAKNLDRARFAYTVFIDGTVMLCGGIAEYWNGRGEAWAVLHPKCKRHFMDIHGAVKRFLEICPLRRIEASVDCDFVSGHRWVKALGFSVDAPRLKSFLPDGKDASLYSIVRDI